jgi:hypothetical protein
MKTAFKRRSRRCAKEGKAKGMSGAAGVGSGG